MKCTNCGHELEPGSGFCENCGTIMSLDSEFDESVENESIDVFSGSEPVDENEPEFNNDIETAQELEIDETEQVVESEVVSDEDALAGVSYAELEQPQNEADQPADEAPASTEEQPAEQGEEEENAFDAAKADYADDSSDEEAEEDENDDLDDMYITTKKTERGGAAVAVMVVFLIVIVAVGASVIKNNFTSKPPVNVNLSTSGDASQSSDTTKTTKKETPTTKESSEETSADETSAKPTEETTETTTKPVVTAENTTEKATQASDVTTTSKPVTTAPTTKAPTQPSTTAQPSTTKPAVTSPSTTAAPTTAKPTTGAAPSTKPSATTSATKPQSTATSTTADPYGFNFAPVQKPNKYVSETYKVYVTANALSLRSKPTTDSERIVFLPVGTSCTVYGAKENGFLYVRSDRYGVYGWVSTEYVSTSRQESTSTTVVPNLVEPDKKYEKAQVKYVTDAAGLRLRKGPSTSYDVITCIDKGFPVKVIGYSTTVSGWVYVLDTTHGVYGWVSSAYIK